MRVVGALLSGVWVVACAVPEDTPLEVDTVEAESLRFERLARVDNPGNGVVAASEGGAWLSRAGVLERVDAWDGTVVDTVRVDGEVAPDLTLLDGDAAGFLVTLGEHDVAITDARGTLVDAFVVPDVVRSGGLTATGAWVTYDTPDGCRGVMLVGSDLVELGAVGCHADRPVSTGESRLATDADGQTRFELEPGSHELVRVDAIDTASAQESVFGLERPAIDVAAQDGQVLVLSPDGIMTHLDPSTGEVLAEWQVHQPASIGSIALTNTADTIVLASDDVVVFFALDPSAPGYPLVEGVGNPGQTPGGSGSGSGPSGGASGGSGAASAGASGSL